MECVLSQSRRARSDGVLELAPQCSGGVAQLTHVWLPDHHFHRRRMDACVQVHPPCVAPLWCGVFPMRLLLMRAFVRPVKRMRLAVMANFWNKCAKPERFAVFHKFLEMMSEHNTSTMGCSLPAQWLLPHTRGCVAYASCCGPLQRRHDGRTSADELPGSGHSRWDAGCPPFALQ